MINLHEPKFGYLEHCNIENKNIYIYNKIFNNTKNIKFQDCDLNIEINDVKELFFERYAGNNIIYYIK